ncbi:MAG: hypothetical protein ACI9Y7_002722, partial [Dokdonia sp.]
AFDIADGLKKLTPYSKYLYFMGEEELSQEEIQTLQESQQWVSEQLDIPSATIILDIAPEGTPIHAITGINGFGCIVASKSTLTNKPLLVHEITHCSLMSRALFLDEGLATFFQHEVNGETVSYGQTYWDRPSIAALIEIDWSDDPYFLKVLNPLNDPSTLEEADLRVHHLGTHVIKAILEKNTISDFAKALPRLKAQLREGKTAEVFKSLFSVDVWEMDLAILKNSQPDISKPTDTDTLTEIAVSALALEDKEVAKLWLPYARIMAYDNTEDLISLIKLLILLGNTRENPREGSPYRSEALAAMELAESRGIDAKSQEFFDGYKIAFKLRNAGHSIELRSVGVLASKAFQDLLLKYPDDPEIIIATAKAQIKTDYDLVSMEDWHQKLTPLVSNPLYAGSAKFFLEHERFVVEN